MGPEMTGRCILASFMLFSLEKSQGIMITCGHDMYHLVVVCVYKTFVCHFTFYRCVIAVIFFYLFASNDKEGKIYQVLRIEFSVQYHKRSSCALALGKWFQKCILSFSSVYFVTWEWAISLVLSITSSDSKSCSLIVEGYVSSRPQADIWWCFRGKGLSTVHREETILKHQHEYM